MSGRPQAEQLTAIICYQMAIYSFVDGFLEDLKSDLVRVGGCVNMIEMVMLSGSILMTINTTMHAVYLMVMHYILPVRNLLPMRPLM